MLFDNQEAFDAEVTERFSKLEKTAATHDGAAVVVALGVTVKMLSAQLTQMQLQIDSLVRQLIELKSE